MSRRGLASGDTVVFHLAAVFLVLIASVADADGAERSSGSVESSAIRIALPVEFDFDFGAANGDAVINRYLPLVAAPLGGRWRLINLTLAMLAVAPGGVPGRPGNPAPVSGSRVFGFGDLTDIVLFTPPSPSERLVWGFGPGITMPTASDVRLGSGRWSAGPALRVVYKPGSWSLGAVAVNLRSFAGDSDRGEVNQLLVRGSVRRPLGAGWYFVYAPIITASWDAPSGQRWLVPLGGGLGKRFELGGNPLAFSLQAYGNAVKPDGAPHSVVRLNIIVPIPARFRG